MIDLCAKEFLCGLSGPLRNSVKAVIVQQSSVLDSQIANATAQIASLEAQLLPIEASLQTATAALQTLKASATIQLFDGNLLCNDIGELKLSLFDNAQIELTELNDFLQDARKKISFIDELSEGVKELSRQRDRLGEFLDQIDLC